jgi:hypothetical protein
VAAALGVLERQSTIRCTEDYPRTLPAHRALDIQLEERAFSAVSHRPRLIVGPAVAAASPFLNS